MLEQDLLWFALPYGYVFGKVIGQDVGHTAWLVAAVHRIGFTETLVLSLPFLSESEVLLDVGESNAVLIFDSKGI